jgi:hypothetical protein
VRSFARLFARDQLPAAPRRVRRVAALAAILGLVILLILREAETALEDDKDRKL